ncbi:hypothetical protein [Actinophytocola sp.]|uniref:hypothetical protein n=1 Tax=Actinophytocola sp. TaxID=1872138 RepID=UPI00389A2175
MRIAADAYARAVAADWRTHLAPIQDRGRLLGELLLARSPNAAGPAPAPHTRSRRANGSRDS